jgi:hypothetical protein
MNLRRPLALLVLPLGCIFATPTLLQAQAQATTGVIRGTVADSTGRPLDNAIVPPMRNAR